MTKEQEIYKNMKKRGRIYKKRNGKYGIDYPSLFVAIKEAGYDDDEMIEKIIKNMIDKGYLSKSHDGYNKGLRYVIEKWVN